MPLTQLVQRLSASLDRRNSTSNNNTSTHSSRDAESMEVVAEVVVPLPNQGASLCSTSSPRSSRAGSDAALSPRGSAAGVLASLSGPLPSVPAAAGKPATARALRARGKAMLRTEVAPNTIAAAVASPIELDLQHQMSLESSSSMMMMVDAVSPRGYGRASTAPLPGASSQRAAGPSSGRAVALSVSALQQLNNEFEEEDDADELLPPVGADHCHWEDGVIASWLQGIDHTELLHSGDDDDDEVAEKDGAAAGPSCSKAAAAQPQQHMSHSVPNAVFSSSLLYK